jgi:hypothetical protein
VFDGGTKLAQIMAAGGEPIDSLTLLGPGLRDPAGVEPGARFDEVAGIAPIACEISGEETWSSYVSCRAPAPARSHYVFVLDLDSARIGEALTTAQAEKLLGASRLTAIEVWSSPPAEAADE